MFRKLLTHPTVHLAITGLIALGVLLCVFPDVVPRFSWVVNHAVQLMLFYLFAGLVMLFLKQPKLTFAFFVGCVLLVFAFCARDVTGSEAPLFLATNLE